jgi:hypothetical protein
MSELYQLLSSTADSTGLPVMNTSLFLETIEKYGKEEFRKVLADYITKEKPSFPFFEFNQNKVVENFHKLKQADYTKYIMNSDKEVIEKYDDYKYSYDKYGLGVIEGPPTFNYVSDSFMNDLRMACGSYGYKSAVDRWNEGDNIWGAFGPIFRGVNDRQHLTPRTYQMSFRLGTYIATQFKPIVAKTIYEMSNAKTVLDTSMGWGDRLTAFYASNATHYIGCDPNPKTFARYHDMIKFFDKLTGGKKTTQIYNCGAEDLPWNEIENVDCSFSSPPYWATELYGKNQPGQENQSWFKFNEYDSWRDNFYLPVSHNSFNSLSDRGVLMVNILDPKVKGKRYRSGDELVDHLKGHFIGQVGMRIMQRPQGKSVFSDEDGNFDKSAMDVFMKKIYIENIWCFSKDTSIDLFKDTRRGTLEDFI